MTVTGVPPTRGVRVPGGRRSHPAPVATAPVELPAAPAELPAPPAPARRTRPLVHRGLQRAMALLFAAGFIAGVAVEPDPDGSQPDPPLWTLPLALLTLAALIAACVSLWRGGRRGGELGVLAGLALMAGTVTCPVTDHHLIGWYVWVQGAVSAFVLLASTALVIARPVDTER